MDTRKRKRNEAFADTGVRSDQSEQLEKYDYLQFDPFSRQGDEETPTTFSLFEEKYLALDEIPAHLKRVGGLKDLISTFFLEASQHVSNPGGSWGNLVEEHVSTLMFLYLHITSSPSNDSTQRAIQFAHLLASTLRAFFSSHTASTIHFPHVLIRVFELDLLKRILPSNNAQSTLQYDLGIMKFLPTDHFRDQHFALCAEYMLPICLICEKIIKSTSSIALLTVAINGLQSQLVIRYSYEALFGGNAEVDEFFHRISEAIFGLLLHSHQSVRRNACGYLSASSQFKSQDPLLVLMDRINDIRLSTLSEEDAIILASGGKALQSLRSETKTDWRINRALDIIERLKDSPLVLSYFIFIRKTVKGDETFRGEETLRRLLPVLFAKAMLPERKVPSLLSITTQSIFRYGSKKIKLEGLPIDLCDRFLTSYRSEIFAYRVLANHSSLGEGDWDAIMRKLSRATIQILCSMRSGVPGFAFDFVLEMLLVGFAENPDWRKRESLVMLAGTIADELLFCFGQDFSALNPLLIHVFNALQDPVDAVKQTACGAVAKYHVAVEEGNDLNLPLSVSDLVPILTQYAWEAESKDLSVAAFSALCQLMETGRLPELMKPYFIDFLRRSEDAIPRLNAERLFPMVNLVHCTLTVIEDLNLECPPHRIPELLIIQLEDCMKTATEDDICIVAEPLLTCLAKLEGRRMMNCKSRLIPICHQVTAWDVKQPHTNVELARAVLEIMADFFDSDKKDEHLLTEDYKELVLRALKVRSLLFSVFNFLEHAWGSGESALLKPILDSCFEILCANLLFNRYGLALAAYPALGKAFQVYDFTEEQISSFLATSARDTHVVSPEAVWDAVGTALAMCGIRHARFMCNINLSLLQCLIKLHNHEDPPSAQDSADRRQFFVGACNIWEALIRSNRLKDDPKLAEELTPVLNTVSDWAVDFLFEKKNK